MRSRRMMHGRRNRRSSCLKMVDQESVVQPVEMQDNASEEPNYTPTEQDIYNPMDAGAQRLKDKDMNIERQK
jgi:hypothetical protein